MEEAASSWQALMATLKYEVIYITPACSWE